MRLLSCSLAVAALLACGHVHHPDDFSNQYELCYQHIESAGVTDKMEDCDQVFSLSHTDEADCLSDHSVHVTAGVPQSSVDAHCGQL